MSDQGVRPKTKAEARIWNRYNFNSEWDWIPIVYWPSDLSKAVISNSLSYSTRFRLFLYFVGNGMDPRKARDMVKAMLIKYDHKAHIDYLYKDLMKNKKKWTYWDENEKKIQSVDNSLPIVNISGENLEYERPSHNSVALPERERFVFKYVPKSTRGALFDSDEEY